MTSYGVSAAIGARLSPFSLIPFSPLTNYQMNSRTAAFALLAALALCSCAAAAAQPAAALHPLLLRMASSAGGAEALRQLNTAAEWLSTRTAGAAASAAADQPYGLVRGPYFAVALLPGMGCGLMSTYSDAGAEPGMAPSLGPLLALTTDTKLFFDNPRRFACKFGGKGSVAYPLGKNTAGQQLAVERSGMDPSVFVLPPLSSLGRSTVKCAMLYANPQLQTEVYFSENSTYANVTIGGVEIHYSAPRPRETGYKASKLTVDCEADTALVGDQSTLVRDFGIIENVCFPGTATVATPAGPKRMSELAVGDRVLALDPATGATFWDDVYLVPHRDADTATGFLRIHATAAASNGTWVQAGRVLTLTPRHYVPTACGDGVCMKHAASVAEGDMVWLVEGGAGVLARVDKVSFAVERGVYSPWTLSGSLVVDGVHASAHTAWPGESAALALVPDAHAAAAAEHALAGVHHAVQGPLRAAYRLLGPAPLRLLDGVIFRFMEAGKAAPGAANALAAAGVAAAAARASAVQL